MITLSLQVVESVVRGVFGYLWSLNLYRYLGNQYVLCHVQARLDSCVSLCMYMWHINVYCQLFLSTAVTPGLRPHWDSDSSLSFFLCSLHQLFKDFHFDFLLNSKNNLQFDF